MNYKTIFIIGILFLIFGTTIVSASFTSYNPMIGTHTYWVGADGGKIVLTNNNGAVNPTYAQLLTFLKADATDQRRYSSRNYACGDFAETVHNNAERAGWKAGCITMNSINHAANVFQTRDKGTVYIDCTGSPSGGRCYDTKVAARIGYSYKRVPLFCSGTYFGSMGTVRDLRTYW